MNTAQQSADSCTCMICHLRARGEWPSPEPTAEDFEREVEFMRMQQRTRSHGYTSCYAAEPCGGCTDCLLKQVDYWERANGQE